MSQHFALPACAGTISDLDTTALRAWRNQPIPAAGNILAAINRFQKVPKIQPDIYKLDFSQGRKRKEKMT
ncbi:MAG: hypothetical protein AAF636_00095 [Pseudomonadota bacterium]